MIEPEYDTKRKLSIVVTEKIINNFKKNDTKIIKLIIYQIEQD